MKRFPILLIGLCCAIAVAVAGQAPAAADDVELVTISGSVVRYEPGRTIVIRGDDRKEVVYTLTPEIVVPADVRVGAAVTLHTEPSPAGGAVVVRRITTTAAPATVEVTGRVVAYESGKTLTIVQADGTREVYMLTASSTVPTDLVVGKTISIVPVVSADTSRRVVRSVTYVTAEPPGGS
jgi:hypothetical protein